MSNNNMIFFCSSDGCQLYDLYHPDIDETILLDNPKGFDDLSEVEKQNLKTRRDFLIETLENLSQDKQKRMNEIITKQSGIILACPQCKKIFDSNSISLQEKTYGDNNILPYRKPKTHKVISDDKESLEKENNYGDNNTDSFFMGARQIFFGEEKEEDKQKKLKRKNINNTLFKQRQTDSGIENIVHASKEIKHITEKFGKDSVNIQVQVAE